VKGGTLPTPASSLIECVPNKSVQLAAPEGHETGGTAEVTFWSDGKVSLRLLQAKGRLKISTLDLDGLSLEVITERDW